ncbi:hypothetical protein [Rummeliibacillus pycnus]|uniref:hypothetical protein n=1 Tax=Rummeliibacillus pycnus TaxID=101070 RepID=UPI000C9CC4C3|nr:hypothetical protein [Rummeliibacillus pycnus]
MVDVNGITKDTATLLLKEIESSIQHFTEDSIQSLDKQRNLAQRRQLLINAYAKTSSGMTQLIMTDMINEIDQEIAHLEENARYCETQKGYYIEILRVVKETAVELKL